MAGVHRAAIDQFSSAVDIRTARVNGESVVDLAAVRGAPDDGVDAHEIPAGMASAGFPASAP